MKSKSARILLAALVAVVVVGLTIFYVVNRAVTKAEHAGKAIAEAFDAVFQARPRITINNRVIVLETKAITELASASKELQVRYEYRNSRFRSEKTMILTGKYRAKAGFNLEKRFSLSVDSKTSAVVIALPKPTILTCEMLNQEIESSDNGWWNSLTVQDHALAVDAMTAKAHEEALNSTLLKDAKQNFENKVRQMPELKSMSVRFDYEETPDR